MYNMEKSIGYPILEGSAVVKVSLTRMDPLVEETFLGKLKNEFNRRFLYYCVGKYYHGKIPVEDIYRVGLEKYDTSVDTVESLEVDDSDGGNGAFLDAVKGAAAAIITAGVIVLSVMGLTGKTGGGGNGGMAGGAVISGDSDKNKSSIVPIVPKVPVIFVQSEREKSLFASLNPPINPQPAERHYFRLGGHQNISHTNVPGSHVDNMGETPHVNVLTPHGDHNNHANSSHMNHTNTHDDHANNTHNNTPHTNHTNTTHTNNPHNDYADVTHNNTPHTNTTGTTHTNSPHTDTTTPQHSNSPHSNHSNAGHNNTPHNDYSDGSHNNTPHTNHSNTPHSNSHNNTTSPSHTNTHSNTAGAHTNSSW